MKKFSSTFGLFSPPFQSGGDDGVAVNVNIDNAGTKTKLLFGSNVDLESVRIDGDTLSCTQTEETAYAIKIQNGVIIKSQCINYCIEIIPAGDIGNAVSVLKNDAEVSKTPETSSFVNTFRQCFSSFNLQNDIIELRHS